MQESYKITLLVMWMTALGQAAVTIYLPAFPAIAHGLHIAPALVKSTISIFLLSYGLSQFFYGPLSDRYGRKPLLLTGITIFCLGCLLNCFAKSLDIFLLARFLQGLGCGSVITIGRSILLDKFRDRELSSAASYLSMGFAIGLGTTPIIGAYLQSWLGWQADFVFLIFVGALLFILIAKFLPETAPSLLPRSSVKEFLQHTLRDYQTVIVNPTFLKFLLGGLFAYSVVITYNVMSPFLIQNKLGYSADVYGWLAIVIAIPYYVAASSNRKLVLKFGSGPIIAVGAGMIIGAGIVLLLLANFSLPRGWQLTAFIVPLMLATFGQAMVFPNAISGALKNFSHIPGRASAMLSSLQMLLVGVVAAILALLPDTQMTVAGVLVVLGLLSTAVLWKQMRREGK